jgi:DnaB-like helicase C terminal domain
MLPLERTILRQLFHNRDFAARVVPYLKTEYFHDEAASKVYQLFSAFFEKFHTLPSFAAIRIGIDSIKSLTEREAQAAMEALKEVEAEAPLDETQDPWILESTEEFCQDRAVYCGLQECIKVMDDPKATRHVIPDIMKGALAVNFDQHIGHDQFGDADARYEFYHKQEARIPFDLQTFNQMTKGGVPRKTLNVVMAGTNVGKSLFLVHMAAACLRQNKNVLYITLEMAEERIAERIDANLMNLPIDDVNDLPRSDYIKKIINLRQASTGRLIIKEFPTGGAHCGHFRALLQELHLKQNFKPDIIFVDYISICSSSRIKMGQNVNSYTLYKFVAEELRGLAVEYNVPVFSAAQFNRQGFASADPGMDNVGESWAIPQTADFMFALVTNEDLEKLGQITVQPMKNRYAKRNSFQHFLVGIDTDRMKLYDLTAAQIAQSQSMMQGPAPSKNASYGVPKAGSVFGPRQRRPLSSFGKPSDSDDDYD